jgi:hypothetical protein
VEEPSGRDPAHVKRAPRVDLRRPGVLVHEDGRETEVSVLDVSSRGFRLEVQQPPAIGEKVILRVDKFSQFPVEIRWVRDGEAGGVLVAPVDFAQW